MKYNEYVQVNLFLSESTKLPQNFVYILHQEAQAFIPKIVIHNIKCFDFSAVSKPLKRSYVHPLHDLFPGILKSKDIQVSRLYKVRELNTTDSVSLIELYFSFFKAIYLEPYLIFCIAISF